MGADKNSLRRGTRPISQIHFQILKSSSCQIHVATEVLLDLEQVSNPKRSQPQRNKQLCSKDLHRSDRSPAPVRPVKAGSPETPHRVTRALPETNRVTRTPTPGHPPNTCDFPQKQQHRSDRSPAPVRSVPDQLLKTCPELVQKA